MKRRICYISGTRADFGLMRSTLARISQQSDMDIFVAATGMHLDPQFGGTLSDIADSNLNYKIINSPIDDGTRTAMAISVGEQVIGFTQLLADERPDILLLLGDRGEMLAGAIAALYLNIPVVHIHGGELSGTVDESIRHAVSKLSHVHFTATERSKARLISMGEQPDSVFVTGAPGLDDIVNLDFIPHAELCDDLKLDPNLPILTVVYHPVVQDAEQAGEQMREVLSAIPDDVAVVVLMPNADAGGILIRESINEFGQHNHKAKIVTHLTRTTYLSLLKHSHILLGNSSSGIIEAASLGTWVINIGERQANRERNSNIYDVEVDAEIISKTIDMLKSKEIMSFHNVYGDGNAGMRITSLLSKLKIDSGVTKKRNAY